ncbi:MAG: rod shape-determining protein MreC, partial [Bacillota bacterium]
MSRFNQKTLIILISLLLLVIALGIISFAGIEVSFLNWIEKGIYNFITPIIEYITGFFNMAGNYWSNIMNIDQLIEENKMLREKISEYEIQNNMNEYYKLENIRLRKLLSFKKQISFDSLGARVIGHSSSHWDHRLIINRGSKDGVEERMPVITY